jgi:hypothetical protein
MAFIREKVTGMMFNGTDEEIRMWKRIMISCNKSKDLVFEETNDIGSIVDNIEKSFEGTAIKTMEDFTGITGGKIFIQFWGKGYRLEVCRDHHYDTDWDGETNSVERNFGWVHGREDD